MKLKYRRKLEIYKQMVIEGWPLAKLDFSDKAAQEMFEYETLSKGEISIDNGYYVGKKWWDWQVEAWKEDLLKGLITGFELREDKSLPSKYVDAAIQGAFGINPNKK